MIMYINTSLFGISIYRHLASLAAFEKKNYLLKYYWPWQTIIDLLFYSYESLKEKITETLTMTDRKRKISGKFNEQKRRDRRFWKEENMVKAEPVVPIDLTERKRRRLWWSVPTEGRTWSILLWKRKGRKERAGRRKVLLLLLTGTIEAILRRRRNLKGPSYWRKGKQLIEEKKMVLVFIQAI